MPLDRVSLALDSAVAGLVERGTSKGAETVVSAVIKPRAGRGPRFLLEGEGAREFLRMNSNSYLGLGLREEIIAAEEIAAQSYGAGPGAVRFISGTYDTHLRLEQKLASFHGRESAMLFSAAYAAVLSVFAALTTDQTIIISDELNHNCIINGMRLARPLAKAIYRHVDLAGLGAELEAASGKARRVIVVTDGIFSMRGDHAPLAEIMALAAEHDANFPENVMVVVDDSHGVGAFGTTGRGTEEYTGAPPSDILVGTLGKAFGVNGGYVVTSASVIGFLRETSPTYIYSNPITPAEAAAALRSLEIVDSARGRELLDRLRALTKRFQQGLTRLGLEIIPGDHPVVPLMVRDTTRTRALVNHLRAHGVLATGLAYPVVPRGDEEIRFQINADHTETDVDEVLGVLRGFTG
ncbi:MAG: aminotransferase class I/II-fold pyridoxal phosphate-dependent enzyme [Longimicrobiales bacterium]